VAAAPAFPAQNPESGPHPQAGIPATPVLLVLTGAVDGSANGTCGNGVSSGISFFERTRALRSASSWGDMVAEADTCTSIAVVRSNPLEQDSSI
jgi:hypothetical protein